MFKLFQTKNQLFYKIFSLMQALSLFCVIVTTVWTSTHYGYILFNNTKENPSITLTVLTSISLSMVITSSIGQIFIGAVNWSYDKNWEILLSGSLCLSLWLTWFAKIDLVTNIGFLNEVRVMDFIRWISSIALILVQPFLAFRVKK